MSAKKQTTAIVESSQGGDQATYVSRPRRKPDSTTKGKLNEWDNGYKEFIPQGQKASNRNMLKQLGNSSYYKSEGEKESSYTFHVNVPGDSADPVGKAYDIMKVLTEGQRKSEPTLPEGEGRMLFDNGENLKVWLDTVKGKVSILTQLDCSSNIERMLLQAQATMNVTIGRHRTEILKHEINELK
jgi:hypothetical protein